MTKISSYQNFNEKEIAFNSEIINTKEDFDELYSKFRNSKSKSNLIFRGMTEAKYKLFNSAQRQWLNLELANHGYTYSEFILREIHNAKTWQNNLLEKFYNGFGLPAYDLSVLSFLQHYRAPTPLLDWTYSFDNSLFFAVDGLKYSDSNNKIDNYFSIYTIDTNWPELIKFFEALKNILIQIDEIIRKYPKIEAKKVLEGIESLSYETLNEQILTYIPGYKKGGFVFKLLSRPSFHLFYNQSNLNIINQKGLFVFNASENKPLEYFFQGLNVAVKGSPYQIPKIINYNIHKHLKEYVIHKLTYRRTIPIDKTYIYPQEEIIAETAYINYLKYN